MLIDYKKVNVYQENNLILEGADLQVDAGQMVYIIGKVGSGKSSLLKTIYCELDVYDDESEAAEVLGRNVAKLKRRDIPSLRREMGIIFQDFQLLHDRTVYKNLRFVLRSTGWKSSKDIDARIDKVLSDVGLLDKKDKFPHELSGGEQQRVAIARALLNDPKIIIADEPTGNLDYDSAEKIVSLLYDITKTGASVVMSTHNINMLDKFPGTVYKCCDGHIEKISNDSKEA